MRDIEFSSVGSPPLNAFPRGFFRIRLEVAREAQHPSSKRRDGYVFVAPLDSDGQIDSGLWRCCRDECRVVRFRPDDENIGHLIRRSNGDWAFHYEDHNDRSGEIGARLGNERFVAGEYILIEESEAMRTFKVASVEQV